MDFASSPVQSCHFTDRCVKAIRVCLTMMALVTIGCDQVSPHGGGPDVGDTQVEPNTPQHGFLGLTFESVDQVPLVIKGTVPGSGAETNGIVAGDVLLNVSGKLNPSYEELYGLVSETVPGQELLVTVRRNGQQLDYSFPLMSFDEVQAAMEALDAEK